MIYWTPLSNELTEKIRFGPPPSSKSWNKLLSVRFLEGPERIQTDSCVASLETLDDFMYSMHCAPTASTTDTWPHQHAARLDDEVSTTTCCCCSSQSLLGRPAPPLFCVVTTTTWWGTSYGSYPRASVLSTTIDILMIQSKEVVCND